MVSAQQLLDEETSYKELGIREVGQEPSRRSNGFEKLKQIQFKDKVERTKKQQSAYNRRKRQVPLTPPKGKLNAGKLGRSIAGLLAGRGQVVSASGGSGKGRGRPEGTFKARYVPGVGTVKVPTAVYKKMISQHKAQASHRVASTGLHQGYLYNRPVSFPDRLPHNQSALTWEVLVVF